MTIQSQYGNGSNRIWNGSDWVTDSLVLPKTSGVGIKVDDVNPTFPWEDILSPTILDESGGPNRPTFTTFYSPIKSFKFGTGDHAFYDFHVPHHYLVGSDVFVHVHWGHNSASVTSGGVVFTIEATSAKGHSQQSFNNPITTTISPTTSTTQYYHQISETQLSASGGAGGLLNTASLEPDSLILIRLTLTTNTISAATDVFVFYCDLHIQTTNIGTKNKVPNFYS